MVESVCYLSECPRVVLQLLGLGLIVSFLPQGQEVSRTYVVVLLSCLCRVGGC